MTLRPDAWPGRARQPRRAAARGSARHRHQDPDARRPPRSRSGTRVISDYQTPVRGPLKVELRYRWSIGSFCFQLSPHRGDNRILPYPGPPDTVLGAQQMFTTADPSGNSSCGRPGNIPRGPNRERRFGELLDALPAGLELNVHTYPADDGRDSPSRGPQSH
jgi:hypothetical protein